MCHWLDLVQKKSVFVSRLDRVVQLTGFSDPVYAEATVLVNQFDISVDVLVVNQTADVMQNLSVELATVGDLKLCERPQAYTMAPKEQINMKVSIKVSSTETGIIFGNIVYDGAGPANERSCVILNDIHIDSLQVVPPRLSGPCGQSLSGKIKWPLIQRLSLYVSIWTTSSRTPT